MPARKSISRKRPSFKFLTSIVNRVLKLNIVYLLGFLLIVASFLIGVLITKVSFLEQNGSTDISKTDAAAEVDGPQAPTGPVDVSEGHLPLLGNKDAKVTIVEFADFQCPFCKQWFTNITPSLKRDYIDSGKIRFYYRHYAFLGQESTDAALASECANEQDKFWEYHDYLFENQGAENSGTFSKDNLKGFASTLGLDVGKFNDCLDSAKYQKNVDKDVSEGGKAGVNGTPATFVNGVLISGAAPYADFKAEIDKALAN